MKSRSSAGFVIVLLAVGLAGGFAFFSQWQHAMELEKDLKLARVEAGELPALRAENRRLHEKQISAKEIEALRADHVALLRLRAELETLTKKTASAEH